MSYLLKNEPPLQSCFVKSEYMPFDHENKMCFNYQPFEVIERKEKLRKTKSGDDDYCVKEAKSLQVRWNKTEDENYVKFIKENAILFDSENLRRTGRVFMRMSLEMNGLRTPSQCKSHHQKMQRVTKGGNLDKIIAYLTKKYASSQDKDTKTREIDYSKSQSVQQELNENGHRSVILHFGKIAEMRVELMLNRIAEW